MCNQLGGFRDKPTAEATETTERVIKAMIPTLKLFFFGGGLLLWACCLLVLHLASHPLAASIMGIRWGQAFGCSALPLLHSGPKKKFQTSEQSENLLLQRRDGEKEGKGKKEKKLREFFSLSRLVTCMRTLSCSG